MKSYFRVVPGQKATREDVYSAINTERDYQDAGTGNALRHENMPPMTPGELILCMEKCLSDARVAWYAPNGGIACLDHIRKVAALGVQAMELHGAHPRLSAKPETPVSDAAVSLMVGKPGEAPKVGDIRRLHTHTHIGSGGIYETIAPGETLRDVMAAVIPPVIKTWEIEEVSDRHAILFTPGHRLSEAQRTVIENRLNQVRPYVALDYSCKPYQAAWMVELNRILDRHDGFVLTTTLDDVQRFGIPPMPRSTFQTRRPLTAAEAEKVRKIFDGTCKAPKLELMFVFRPHGAAAGDVMYIPGEYDVKA